MVPFLYVAMKSLYWSNGKTLKKIMWCDDDKIKPYFIKAGKNLTYRNLRRQLTDSLEDKPFPKLPEELQKHTFWEFGSKEEHFKYRSAVMQTYISVSYTHLSIASIELHRLPSAETAEKIYLNKEIEELWTDEDRKLFQKLSPEERVFYADYLSTEFETTKFLVEFAKTNKAVLEGLEYRVKSPKSLYNKLYQRVEKSFFDSLADVVRYTIILDPEDYVEQIRSVITALSEKNWKIYALKNYWTNDSFPYNGVNTKFKNPRNYRIEIQFHTKESFDVKMSKEDHDLYEQRRVLEPGCDEYNRILQLQLNLYSNMEYPKNIALLDNI